MSGFKVEWAPPGPVMAAFMASRARVQGACGPVGGGKTTTALVKHVTLAAQQQPSPRRLVRGMPVRMYKVCIVRDTYRNLWRSLLPSWFKRVPRDTGAFIGGENAPAKHCITFRLPDNTVVEFQADFVAMGDGAAEDVLGGYEPTAFHLDEVPNLSSEVFTFARGRAGRYPDVADGGATWRGVTATMNSPELGNWCFDGIADSDFNGFFAKLPEGFAMFQQPSGLSPRAENLANLPPDYYRELAAGSPRWYVARMIECKPGYSRHGKPVYPEYDDTLHAASEPLRAMPGRQLIIGLDAGLQPAAALCQIMPNGQFRVLAELVCEPGVGPERFSARLAQLLVERFPDHLGTQIRAGRAPLIMGWADPSAMYGADKKADEKTWVQKVAAGAGIRIRPAPSNGITKRTSAVRAPLMRLIEGEPGLLLSPDCSVLRKGFAAAYKFAQRRVAGDVQDLPEIVKNEFSHVHDALQYAALGGGTDFDAAERRERMTSGPRQERAIDEAPGGW